MNIAIFFFRQLYSMNKLYGIKLGDMLFGHQNFILKTLHSAAARPRHFADSYQKTNTEIFLSENKYRTNTKVWKSGAR